MADIDANLNLYDINENIMRQLPIIENGEEIINKLNFYIENLSTFNYLMMLCREQNDYTLFYFDTFSQNNFAEDVLECFANRGVGIVSLELIDNNNAVEVWVKDAENDLVYLYYIFVADQMVIEY